MRKSGLATQVATKERLDATREFVHRHISEVIYQTIFLSKKHPITFYPVGGAANYSFLYLIDRIMEENDIRRVIEFGAGQTTLLFSLWRKKKSFVFYSVEHEEFWKEEMIKK